MPSLKEYVEKAKKKGLTKKEISNVLLEKGYSKKEIEEAFSTQKQIYENETLSVGEKIKGLFQPTTFFQSFRDEKIISSFVMYVVSLLIVSGISLIFSSIMSRSFFGFSFFSFFILILGIIALPIYVGITHLVIILTKHEGSFKDTHNVVTYSLVPCIIFSIIPFVGLLSIIYSIVLMVQGLSHYHNISKGKALVAALAPIILVLAILAFIILSLIISFRGFGSGAIIR